MTIASKKKKAKPALPSWQLILPMLRGSWGYVFALFGLVLFTSILEGLGFSLVIPLFQSVLSPSGATSGTSLLERGLLNFSQLFPADTRFCWLYGIITVVFAIKGVGLVAISALSRWFVHTLRMKWATSSLLAYLRSSYSVSAARSHGEVVQNIIGETDVSSQAILILVQFAARIIQTVILVSVLLLANWQLTLLVLFLGAVSFVLFRTGLRRYSYDAGKTQQLFRRAIGDIVTEAFLNIRTVKLLALGPLRARRLRKILLDYRRVDTQFETVAELPGNLVDLVAVTFAAGVVFLTTRILGMPIGDVVPTLGLFGLVLLRLASTTGSLMSVTTLVPSLQVVTEMLNLAPETTSGSVAFPGMQSGIALSGIALHPPDRERVFAGLNMAIEPAGLTAIVGPSGSGKTTLVDLIVRLRDADAGTVAINGRDVRDYDLRSLRKTVSYLAQQPQLFTGTVEENLRLGRMDATDGEIEDAARRAHAHDFIVAMPEGYKTPLGQGGVTLSGGQKQRLALARELLRKPQLYIFDEPTSALDREAEAVITELINELSRTHPVIVISHREDVISGAKAVYRLEDGGAVLAPPKLPGFAAGGVVA